MKFKLLAVALSGLFMFGCASQTFTISGQSGETPTSQKSQPFFIGGIGQEKVTSAAEICGGAENVIKVEAQQTFVDGLLGAVTFGIYTPRTAKVYCKAS